jgi:hypothetical protein
MDSFPHFNQFFSFQEQRVMKVYRAHCGDQAFVICLLIDKSTLTINKNGIN